MGRGRKIKSEKTSIYKGVSFNSVNKVYQSFITVNKKGVVLGYFNDDKLAAVAYDDYVRSNNLIRKLNFPDQEPQNDIPNTRLIRLTRGMFAIVDEDDYEKLNQYEWSAVKGCNTYYARAAIYINNKQKSFAMHQIIMGISELDIDHKNRNGLHNYKSNLRFCNRSQNIRNAKTMKKCVSTYKGVDTHQNKFRSRIYFNNKSISIGYYNNEIDAAIAYDQKAKELYGEFAWLNFP